MPIKKTSKATVISAQKTTVKSAAKSAAKAKKPFYITTTLPYVNAEPHVGHALEFVRADVIARAKKLAGYDVFFNTGVDEHGIKVFQKAKQLHMEPQAYVDEVATKFKDLTEEYQPRQGKFSRLAIVLDGDLISAPNINEPIPGGSGSISGSGSQGPR